MSNNKRWTKEEEQYLFSQVQNHHGNLQEAFELASKHLDRSAGACTYHWYTAMKRKQEYSCCFVTVGGKTVINNGKNTSNTTNVVKVKTSIFKKIISFFK